MDLMDIITLPDTQSQSDRRGLAVDRAGVRALRLPAHVVDVDGQACATVATFDLGVRVPAQQRGTHMSRLVEVAHELACSLHIARLNSEMQGLLHRMEAPGGEIAVRYSWFVEKSAPKSGRRSLLDVDASIRVRLQGDADVPDIEQVIRVPVTTLCPCSKAISRYGAHNQRSYVTVTLRPDQPLPVAEVVAAVEKNASCPVYGVLKREDEKYVTEAAYENPKFAEDLVRDVFAELAGRAGSGAWAVETENEESIHNHLAYARITRAAMD